MDNNMPQYVTYASHYDTVLVTHGSTEHTKLVGYLIS